MEALEISGKTVAAAIKKALQQLGLSREEVEVTILKKGKSGLLGLGGEEATIRVEPLTSLAAPDEARAAEVALEVLNKLISLMGVSGTVQLVEAPANEGQEDSRLLFNISGNDLGILIGWRGQTLASLQHIVRRIVAGRLKTAPHLSLDVEGYKERRYNSLHVLTLRLAEQVKTTGRAINMEPMPADERRIVHLALADDSRVTTESVGEGEARHVEIVMRS